MHLESAEKTASNERLRVHLDDGAVVEAVHYREDSLCVSSQVGCAVGCPFCASGRNGLRRGLSNEELMGQVVGVEARGLKVQRVTVSGVGEPLHNHLAVRAFVEWCRERRVPASFTTSGGPTERLREALHWPHNGIAISVHAGTEATRARTVPRGPSLEALFDCLREEVPKLTRSRCRRLSLAYLLVRDLNDSDAELDAFTERVRDLPVNTHLYAYNEVPGSGLSAVPDERYQAVYQRMKAAGLNVRRSSQARIDTNGGCGTLVMLSGADSARRARE